MYLDNIQSSFYQENIITKMAESSIFGGTLAAFILYKLRTPPKDLKNLPGRNLHKNERNFRKSFLLHY